MVTPSLVRQQRRTNATMPARAIVVRSVAGLIVYQFIWIRRLPLPVMLLHLTMFLWAAISRVTTGELLLFNKTRLILLHLLPRFAFKPVKIKIIPWRLLSILDSASAVLF